MEGESKTIFSSTRDNSSLDRGDNGNISISNPFAEGIKSLAEALKQNPKEEEPKTLDEIVEKSKEELRARQKAKPRTRDYEPEL